MLRFKDFIKENEAVAVNNAGTGEIAGIGIGPKGEPGGKSKFAKFIIKRKPIDVGKKDE